MGKYHELPIDRKICITVEEAGVYSGLGETAVRALCDRDDCDFLLRPIKRGQRILIKREKFEEYIKNVQF